MEVGLQMRPVPGFDGYYVTSTGRVWSTREWRGQRGRWLKPAVDDKGGHLHLNLMKDGLMRTRRVHSLVAEAFLGRRPVGLEVRHLNGNPADNRVSNLKWGTRSENVRDAVRHGTHSNTRKTHCLKGHEFDYVDRQGRRRCGTCIKAQGKKGRRGV